MNLTMINDYFNVPPIDYIYWTLHVELKFYFLIFLLVLLRQIRNHHVWLPLWLGLALLYKVSGHPFFFGWIINPFYSCYFISGIVFFLIRSRGVTWQRMCLLAVSYLFSVYLSVGQVDGFINEPTHIDRIVAPVLVTLLYLVFYMIATRKLTFTGPAFLAAAGAVTYPVYLLHTRIGKTIYDCYSPYMPKYVLLGVIIAFILLLAYAVHALIERRFTGRLKGVLARAFPVRFLMDR